MQNREEDDAIDFEVVNQKTGDVLGLFTVSMSLRFNIYAKTYEYVTYKASPRQGSLNIHATSTPEILVGDCNSSTDQLSVFTLHS